jgi:glycosyltransferase involved in cell wall biosynthesis
MNGSSVKTDCRLNTRATREDDMDRIKVGFVLLSSSSSPIPSTRIAVLNMFPYLSAAGIDTHVVFAPEIPTERPDLAGLAPRLIAERFDIVVLQKVHGPSAEALVFELESSGIKTVYIVCDLIETKMAQATSATIVVTEFLRQQYPQHLHQKIHVVHDGIEEKWACPGPRSRHHGTPTTPLHAVLVNSSPVELLPQIGIAPDWLRITILGRYPEHETALMRLRRTIRAVMKQSGWKERAACLWLMSSRRVKCLPWSQDRVRTLLCSADLAIIPIDDSDVESVDGLPPIWKRKSENRLTLKMSAGLPVVTTPIPAYEPIIQHGVNGFFARSKHEWIACFNALRDADLRERMGKAAKDAVVDAYSMDEQARKLTVILRNLVPSD